METESSVLEALVEAQGLYITGLYSLAKQKFTTILSSHPNNYDALVYRAYTNLKLNSLEDAAKDAGTALIVDSNRSEALLVKGIILFHQGKFDAAASEIHRAKLILSSLDASDPRRAEADKWEQKIDVERVKRAPGQKAEEQKGERTGNVSQHHPQAGKVSYKWYQNDNKITVEINFGLKKKEDLNVKIENRRVEISFPINESKSFELNLDLFDEIDSRKSQANVHIDRVEIQLEKVNKGRNWTFLERPDSQNEKVLETVAPKPVQETSTQQSGPFYPSSSKVKRDWSKIDKEIEEDMRKHKDEYAGEDPLNDMFKQIYKNADENTRKAMIKSFQTSGGTVLSTNWDEVKEKDYQGKDRPSAPDGQEYRQWGK